MGVIGGNSSQGLCFRNLLRIHWNWFFCSADLSPRSPFTYNVITDTFRFIFTTLSEDTFNVFSVLFFFLAFFCLGQSSSTLPPSLISYLGVLIYFFQWLTQYFLRISCISRYIFRNMVTSLRRSSSLSLLLFFCKLLQYHSLLLHNCKFNTPKCINIMMQQRKREKILL